MKNTEIKAVAIEKSKEIIENIMQILSIPQKRDVTMDFTYRKFDDVDQCVLDINMVGSPSEKHIRLDIDSEHSIILYEQLLQELLDTFLGHETITISSFYLIQSMSENFSGIYLFIPNASKIRINLDASGEEFMNLISKYNQRYNEYMEQQNNQKHAM